MRNQNKLKYYVSAVIRGTLCEDVVLAVSERQAWYLFGKSNGFAMRDFKVLGVEESTPSAIQLEMNL